ncbi:aldehyde dehydrogenase family protein [Gordonia jinghuaiqii]|uniref:Aldehyde dehydrogenase n=1 Tax=Gordonia jinghuaiqii TaxID=2758710 RepID=A0A7D7QWP8_9ACTN|nr:aldehyde dehydrogenase family protein [Gordonia jinghuaiqii]MCR5979538.1 aldehyde dehydrogenase family protein [Gordonia jinghuaiqii]QMT00668.1 aldehyde dehydrogenase [Gordonia jinghuaiqii]
MRELQNHIDGAPVPSRGRERIDLIDPTTGLIQATQPAGCVEDVDHAVAAARSASGQWAALTVTERVTMLETAADRLAADIPELARLEYREMGKPIGLAEEFLAAGIEVFRSGIDDARHYRFVEEISEHGGIRTVTVHRPVGVVAQIIPWNFTVTATLLGLAPLLAAGNCVVLKPSEKAPLSALRMVETLALPPGVMNVVLGDRRAGEPLADHSDVGLVHLTGSVAAGRSVQAATGRRMTRAILELGGKDPVVIDAGVDPVKTAAAVAYGSFVNTGQICTSMERIYVHREIADEFIAALVAEAATYRCGDGADPRTKMGPLVDERQRQIVQRHVDDAITKGATVLTGGSLPDSAGYFYPATVLTDVTSDMVVMREETFGPVAPVQVVDTFAEGIRLACDSEFGLAATVYTDRAEHARAALDISAGMVWINHWQGGGMVRMFEPARNSGLGATGGRAAYDAATRAVSVSHDTAMRAHMGV